MRLTVLTAQWGTVALLLATAGCKGASEAPPPGSAGEQVEVPAPDPNAPGVRQVGPNRYEAVIHAFEGRFAPSEVRVPAGAEVTFRLTSVDLVHGFLIDGAGVKLTVFPDDFREAVHTFADPREYVFFCDEYCGGGHATMVGRIVVE
jgi:cytochrome c oxidase subunit 2